VNNRERPLALGAARQNGRFEPVPMPATMAHEQIDTCNQGFSQRLALFSEDLWIAVHRRGPHALVFSVRKASAKRRTQIKASVGSHRNGLCSGVLDARLTAAVGTAPTRLCRFGRLTLMR
jgi:hypothetical protein